MPVNLSQCPVCQSPIGRYVDKFYGYSYGGQYYYLCECANPECLFCFLTPQLSVDESAELYDRAISESFTYPGPDELEEVINHSYHHNVVTLVKKWRTPPACAVDIRPAEGYVLAGLKRAQYDAIGIESSAAWRKIAETISQTTVISSLDDLEANRKIDLVVMSHVLEHIPYPLHYLLKLKNHLNDNALLFIQVPSYEHINQFKEAFRGNMVLCEVHVNYFTRYSLANLLWRAGFSILSMEIDESPYFFMTVIASVNSLSEASNT